MRILTEVCQHIGKRKEQQDSYAMYEPKTEEEFANFGTLSVVADGMGGMQSGAEASRIAVQSFLSAYMQKTGVETISEALKRSIITANDAVHKLAVELGCGDDCGTTLIATVVHYSGIYWVYAGDSRIYLTDGKMLQQLTIDQIYARKLYEAVQKGLIDANVARQHPQREALTSYLGAEKIDEIGEGNLLGELPTDISVLLCSDGLFKFMTENEILSIYQKCENSTANALVRYVIEKENPSQDNVTVICMGISASADKPEIGNESKIVTEKRSAYKTHLWYAILFIALLIICVFTWMHFKFLKK